MPRAAHQSFGVVSTALNDTTGFAAPLVSHLRRIRDLDAKSTAVVDGVKRKVEERLEATRSGEGDPSCKRTRASGDASSSGASAPSANEREVRDACTDALALADEKVALAQAAYDLIDAHVTRLDRDLRTFDQALLEREAAEAAAAGIKPSTPGGTGGGGVKTENEGAAPRANEAAPVDPNEPRYCVCQRVSFGAMIACDNENCDMEWFHYSCVGLSTEAKFKGNWYCPACTAERRRLKKLEAKEAAAAAKK